VNESRETTIYNDNGDHVSELREWWDGQWQNRTLRTYTYDAQYNCLSSLWRNWSNNQWENEWYFSSSYDANGNELTSACLQWSENQWQNYWLQSRTYDADGREVVYFLQRWSNNQWENSSWYQYTYDVVGNLSFWLRQVWDSCWVPKINPGLGGFVVVDGGGNVHRFYGHAGELHYVAMVTGVASRYDVIPSEYSLCQNYPNPFNPSTTIEFALPHSGYVSLKVYNVLGEEVAALLAGDHAAGTFKATWDASGLPSGVYFYRLTAGGYVQTKKAVLTR
jgi:hypothetical protein